MSSLYSAIRRLHASAISAATASCPLQAMAANT
ncbi:hypothetical protein SLA2020_403170, partial [Shorea laevis]